MSDDRLSSTQEMDDAAVAMRMLEEDEYDDSYEPVSDSFLSGGSMHADMESSAPVADYSGTLTAAKEDIEYSNGLARALDNMGEVFGENSAIGYIMDKAAAFVEDHFGSVTRIEDQARDMRDEMTKEIMAMDGHDTDYVMTASGEPARLGSEAFAEDLSKAAESIRGNEGAEGTESKTLAFMDVIEKDGGIDPVDTAKALQFFNNTAVISIEQGSKNGTVDREQAMQDLSDVMSDMTEDFYRSTRENELKGTYTLSEQEIQQIDEMTVAGVTVKYSDYQLGDDVSQGKSAGFPEAVSVNYGKDVQNVQAAAQDGDILKRSDGSSYENVSERERQSNEAMKAQARSIVLSDGMIAADKASERTGFDEIHIAMDNMTNGLRSESFKKRQIAGGNTDDVKQSTAESYMTMMHGIQAYNDEAVKAIQDKYADDPSGLQRASNGLGKTMRAIVKDAFDVVKNDDAALQFLSKEDKAELDSMVFTGVNVSYSDYEKGMDLRKGSDLSSGSAFKEEVVSSDPQYSDEERELYGNQFDSHEVPSGMKIQTASVDPALASQSKQIQSSFGSSLNHDDRVAMATSTFDSILMNDKSSSFDFGK